MKHFLICVPLALFLSVGAYALSNTQKNALDEAKKIHKDLSANANLIDSVKKKNSTYGGSTRASDDIPDALKALETDWRKYSKEFKHWKKNGQKRGRPMPEPTAGMNAVLNAECSNFLKSLENKYSKLIEIFVMDNMGALVCTNTITGDYDQGDESKWKKIFKDGQEEFVDKPGLDKSVRKKITQVNLPVRSGSDLIGVVTIGVSE